MIPTVANDGLLLVIFFWLAVAWATFAIVAGAITLVRMIRDIRRAGK